MLGLRILPFNSLCDHGQVAWLFQASYPGLKGHKNKMHPFKMKMKEESEKVGLKLNIQKTRIMASGPIISWQIYGETVETVADFIFLGSKITTDGD